MDVHQQDRAVPDRAVGELALHGTVSSVSCNDGYSFTKPVRAEITLIGGFGVAGDVHAGVTVKHRSRVAADPTRPNLRQVHLIHAELHDELRPEGYEVPAGGLGENVTTTGLDLLALPVGTILRFGPSPATETATTAERSTKTETGTTAETSTRTETGTTAGIARTAHTGMDAETATIAKTAAAAAPASEAMAAAGPAEGAAAVVAAAAIATLDASATAAVAALAARINAERANRPAASGAPAAHRPASGEPAAHRPADDRSAIVITGLRNPCQQINTYRSGLLKQVLGRDTSGNLIRKAGVMGVVLRGGPIRPGDPITVDLPAPPYLPLDRV